MCTMYIAIRNTMVINTSYIGFVKHCSNSESIFSVCYLNCIVMYTKPLFVHVHAIIHINKRIVNIVKSFQKSEPYLRMILSTQESHEEIYSFEVVRFLRTVFCCMYLIWTLTTDCWLIPYPQKLQKDLCL